MPNRPWWETISAEDLVALRRRLLRRLQQDFPGYKLSDLEDAVQGAFLNALGNRERIAAENDGLFRYLGTAARRRVIDRWRYSKVREDATKPLMGPAQSREPPDALAHAERIEKIKEYLHQLDDRSRFIIWKHVAHGLPIKAIAEQLQCDRHTVSRVLQSAVIQVRRWMRGDH